LHEPIVTVFDETCKSEADFFKKIVKQRHDEGEATPYIRETMTFPIYFFTAPSCIELSHQRQML